MGETEGMRPHDIGYDEFYGYYRAQKEYIQRFDDHRYPDLVLDEDKRDRYDSIGADDTLTYGLKDGTTEVIETVSSVQDMAEGDGKLRDYTLKRIPELAATGKPFFLTHAFMKVHADNWPSEAFRGASASKYPYTDAVVEVDTYIGDIVQALEDAGSWKTPSSSSPPTTARRWIRGPTAATRRSAAPRARLGRGACGFLASPTGRA